MLNSQIDTKTLIGFMSATGLPPLFKAIISFLHPSLYTLTCGQGWHDAAPACYADDRLEALLWLGLTIVAVGYGAMTLYWRLHASPSPPPGAQNAVISKDAEPVYVPKNGIDGPSASRALPGTVADSNPVGTPPAAKP